MNDDRDLAVHAYESWGFRNLNKENHRGAEPVGGLYLWPVDGGSLAADPGKILGRLRTRVARASMPICAGWARQAAREFVFMDRAAIGLARVHAPRCRDQLASPVSRIDRGVRSRALERRQKKLLKRFGLAATKVGKLSLASHGAAMGMGQRQQGFLGNGARTACRLRLESDAQLDEFTFASRSGRGRGNLAGAWPIPWPRRRLARLSLPTWSLRGRPLQQLFLPALQRAAIEPSINSRNSDAN